jgi:3-oxoacyl-[acyl-carrier protein] reductase
MFTSVAGRSVIVTGGTRGIGKGIARVFVRAGANVLVTGRDESVAEAAVDELSSLGTGKAAYVLGDVATPEACAAMAAAALEGTAASTSCAPTPASSPTCCCAT